MERTNSDQTLKQKRIPVNSEYFYTNKKIRLHSVKAQEIKSELQKKSSENKHLLLQKYQQNFGTTKRMMRNQAISQDNSKRNLGNFYSPRDSLNTSVKMNKTVVQNEYLKKAQTSRIKKTNSQNSLNKTRLQPNTGRKVSIDLHSSAKIFTQQKSRVNPIVESRFNTSDNIYDNNPFTGEPVNIQLNFGNHNQLQTEQKEPDQDNNGGKNALDQLNTSSEGSDGGEPLQLRKSRKQNIIIDASIQIFINNTLSPSSTQQTCAVQNQQSDTSEDIPDEIQFEEDPTRMPLSHSSTHLIMGRRTFGAPSNDLFKSNKFQMSGRDIKSSLNFI